MFKHTLDNDGHATAIHATYAIQTALTLSGIARIAGVQVACPIEMVNSASDGPVSSWWRITFNGLSPAILGINPPCTKSEVMTMNRNADLYEPIPEPFYIEELPND